MPHSLRRLVYWSRNRLSREPAALASAIAQILAVSRRNNARADITGALMFNAGCFAQVLEGPQDTVEATFERIQRDERHGDVTILAFDEIAARSFGPWAMGFFGKDLADANGYAGVIGANAFDPASTSPDLIVDALKRLALEEEMAS